MKNGPEGAYDYLAYPNEQNEYYQQTKDAYKATGFTDEEAEVEANIVFEKYLLAAYIRTSTKIQTLTTLGLPIYLHVKGLYCMH